MVCCGRNRTRHCAVLLYVVGSSQADKLFGLSIAYIYIYKYKLILDVLLSG